LAGLPCSVLCAAERHVDRVHTTFGDCVLWPAARLGWSDHVVRVYRSLRATVAIRKGRTAGQAGEHAMAMPVRGGLDSWWGKGKAVAWHGPTYRPSGPRAFTWTEHTECGRVGRWRWTGGWSVEKSKEVSSLSGGPGLGGAAITGVVRGESRGKTTCVPRRILHLSPVISFRSYRQQYILGKHAPAKHERCTVQYEDKSCSIFRES
jgi:hypothetical protein